jgi:fatty-acyl-CoA synthase
MTGAVLNTINTRLDAETVAYILNFGQVKGLIVDRELLPLAQKALQSTQIKPFIIIVDDETAELKPPVELDVLDYEELINSGDPIHRVQLEA